jgi:hypothetical protein
VGGTKQEVGAANTGVKMGQSFASLGRKRDVPGTRWPTRHARAAQPQECWRISANISLVLDWKRQCRKPLRVRVALSPTNDGHFIGENPFSSLSKHSDLAKQGLHWRSIRASQGHNLQYINAPRLGHIRTLGSYNRSWIVWQLQRV